METPDPYDLSVSEKVVMALQHGLFVLQHVWPLVLVLGVPLVVGGAFLYRAYSAPDVVLRPTDGPLSGPSWDGQTDGGPAAASIFVASEPSGATVFVDGDSVGTTPFNLVDLRAGAYRVALRMAGFAHADTLVTLTSTSETVVDLYLRPASQEPRAVPETIRVATAPPPPAPVAPPPSAPAAPPPSAPAVLVPTTGGVNVSVRPWGTISIDGSVRRRDTDVAFYEELAPGVHRVRVEHPTLGTREQTVRVQAGRTVPLLFDLNASSDEPR